MKQIIAFGLLISFLFISGSISAQSNNPFDIKSRVGEATSPRLIDSASSEIVLPDSSQGSEELQIADLVSPDSISSGNSADTLQVDVSQQESFVTRRQQLMIEENPFNVSHIPLSARTSPKTQVVEQETVQQEEATGKEKSPTSEGTSKFLFWFFLIQLLLLTSLLGINREFIKKINRSISNDNFAKLVARDFNSGYDALFAMMYTIFVISLSTFIYLLVKQKFGISGVSRYLIILGSVAGVYIFRHIFLGFMGYVFPFTKTISYYNFMIILFNSYLGLLLIPVNVLMAYAPESIASIALYAGLAFVVVTYLLRLLRGSLYGYTLVRKYVFHFFLYLCTCEIAPIFILVRFLGISFNI